MNNTLQQIFIPTADTLEQLRLSTEKAINTAFLKFNRPQEVWNAKGLRIKNVYAPFELRDAVNLQYLNTRLESIGAKPKRKTRTLIEFTDISGYLAVLEGYGSDYPELLGRHANGTVGTPTDTTLANDLLTLGARGYQGSGFISTDRAQIKFSAAEDWTATNRGTIITFLTTPLLSDSPAEIMRMGNSGIGLFTTTPQANLHVCGVSSATIPISIITTGSGDTTDETLQFGIYNANYMWIQANKDGTGYRNLVLQPSGANVGIGASPYCKLDVDGMIRSINTNTVSNGVGTEVLWTGVLGIVQAYDRSASTFKELRLQGALLTLNVNAASGNILVKTATNNTDGGVLQINGDLTPDVDQGGSLGTTNVQWDDIKFKGDLIQGTTTRISSTGKGSFATAAVSGLSSYANNAAAVSGGLGTNDLYIETGTDPARLCIVV